MFGFKKNKISRVDREFIDKINQFASFIEPDFHRIAEEDRQSIRDFAQELYLDKVPEYLHFTPPEAYFNSYIGLIAGAIEKGAFTNHDALQLWKDVDVFLDEHPVHRTKVINSLMDNLRCCLLNTGIHEANFQFK